MISQDVDDASLDDVADDVVDTNDDDEVSNNNFWCKTMVVDILMVVP